MSLVSESYTGYQSLKQLSNMKVLYLGNNIIRANFGCRATSMALQDIILQQHEITSVIYGDITGRYTPALYKGEIRNSRWSRYMQKFQKKLFRKNSRDEADFIRDNVDDSLSGFLMIYTKYPPLENIMHSVEACDALMLNGEGTFIFRQNNRYDFNFYLFVLTLAQYLNKKTYVLNAMFSDGSASARNISAIEQARKVLTNCTLVTARDRISFEEFRENIGDKVEYVPDALFTWSKYSSYKSIALDYPLAGVVFPDYDWQWKEFDFSKPYIALSAGSREIYGNDEEYLQQYIKLVERIKSTYNLVIVQTCGGEEFLKEVAQQTDTKLIDNSTNILFGMSVLANAQCYVSGRWHPSILASLGGTPCVMMKSNSHKSKAIYAELEYNESETIYNNPPSDDEIDEIMHRIHDALKIDRTKIQDAAKHKSELCLEQYAKLLK